MRAGDAFKCSDGTPGQAVRPILKLAYVSLECAGVAAVCQCQSDTTPSSTAVRHTDEWPGAMVGTSATAHDAQPSLIAAVFGCCCSTCGGAAMQRRSLQHRSGSCRWRIDPPCADARKARHQSHTRASCTNSSRLASCRRCTQRGRRGQRSAKRTKRRLSHSRCLLAARPNPPGTGGA